MATRDIEPLELVMWDNAAALGPRMGTAPVCLQVIVVMVMVNLNHFYLAVSEAS